jgi:hypothetical protein
LKVGREKKRKKKGLNLVLIIINRQTMNKGRWETKQYIKHHIYRPVPNMKIMTQNNLLPGRSTTKKEKRKKKKRKKKNISSHLHLLKMFTLKNNNSVATDQWNSSQKKKKKPTNGTK